MKDFSPFSLRLRFAIPAADVRRSSSVVRLLTAVLFGCTLFSTSVGIAQNEAEQAKTQETAANSKNPAAQVDKLIDDLQSRDLERKRDAAYTLARPAVDALPALKTLIDVLDKERDDQVWNQSAMAIAHIGPAAKSAIPVLIRNLENRTDQRRYRASFALGKIGEPAVDELRKALQAGSSDVRAAAAKSFTWIQSEDAIPELIQAAVDSDAQVRRNSGAALAALGQVTQTALRDALAQDDVPFPESLLAVAERIGPLERPTIDVVSGWLESDRPAARAAAVATLLNGHSVDVPIEQLLSRALSDKDDAVRAAGLLALRRRSIEPQAALKSLTQLIARDDNAAASAAVRGLGLLGSAAAPAVPQLVQRLGQSADTDDVISRALMRIGPAAVAPLLSQYSSGAPQNDDRILATLRGIGSRAIPALSDAMQQEDVAARLGAIRALGGISTLPDDVFQSILSQLTNDDARIRVAAADAVGVARAAINRFPESRTRLAELVRQDPVTNVRRAALQALANSVAEGSFEESDPAIVLVKQAIRTAFTSDDVSFQRGAFAALLKAPALAKEFQTELIAGLNSADVSIIESSAAALSAFDTKMLRESAHRDDLATAFTQHLEHASVEVVLQAAQAIAQLQLATDKTPDQLTGLLDHADERVVRASIDALAGLGKQSPAAAARLLKLSSHSDTSVRESVASALPHVAADAEKIVPPLTDMLNDEEWTVRREAAQALGNLGETAIAAVPVLFKLLDSDDDKDAARNALREIDAADERAVPVLINGLRDGDRRKKYYAVFLLQKAGPAAADALPALRQARKDSDSRRFDGMLDRAIRDIEKSLPAAAEDGDAKKADTV